MPTDGQYICAYIILSTLCDRTPLCVHRGMFRGATGCRADWHSTIKLCSSWRHTCKYGNWCQVREQNGSFLSTWWNVQNFIFKWQQNIPLFTNYSHILQSILAFYFAFTKTDKYWLKAVRFTHTFVVRSVLDPEPTDQSKNTASWATTGPVAHPKPLVEVAHLGIQKARTWADRHHMTRNAIQRQNRVRQGVQPNFFHLQQPGQRNLCHWDSGSYDCMW